jgi:hypothetical protein
MTQYDMFDMSWDQKADRWIHTPEGGEIMNRFIRMAIGLKRAGITCFGAKAIAERLRWIR